MPSLGRQDLPNDLLVFCQSSLYPLDHGGSYSLDLLKDSEGNWLLRRSDYTELNGRSQVSYQIIDRGLSFEGALVELHHFEKIQQAIGHAKDPEETANHYKNIMQRYGYFFDEDEQVARLTETGHIIQEARVPVALLDQLTDRFRGLLQDEPSVTDYLSHLSLDRKIRKRHFYKYLFAGRRGDLPYRYEDAFGDLSTEKALDRRRDAVGDLRFFTKEFQQIGFTGKDLLLNMMLPADRLKEGNPSLYKTDACRNLLCQGFYYLCVMKHFPEAVYFLRQHGEAIFRSPNFYPDIPFYYGARSVEIMSLLTERGYSVAEAFSRSENHKYRETVQKLHERYVSPPKNPKQWAYDHPICLLLDRPEDLLILKVLVSEGMDLFRSPQSVLRVTRHLLHDEQKDWEAISFLIQQGLLDQTGNITHRDGGTENVEEQITGCFYKIVQEAPAKVAQLAIEKGAHLWQNDYYKTEHIAEDAVGREWRYSGGAISGMRGSIVSTRRSLLSEILQNTDLLCKYNLLLDKGIVDACHHKKVNLLDCMTGTNNRSLVENIPDYEGFVRSWWNVSPAEAALKFYKRGVSCFIDPFLVQETTRADVANVLLQESFSSVISRGEEKASSFVSSAPRRTIQLWLVSLQEVSLGSEERQKLSDLLVVGAQKRPHLIKELMAGADLLSLPVGTSNNQNFYDLAVSLEDTVLQKFAIERLGCKAEDTEDKTRAILQQQTPFEETSSQMIQKLGGLLEGEEQADFTQSEDAKMGGSGTGNLVEKVLDASLVQMQNRDKRRENFRQAAQELGKEFAKRRKKHKASLAKLPTGDRQEQIEQLRQNDKIQFKIDGLEAKARRVKLQGLRRRRKLKSSIKNLDLKK